MIVWLITLAGIAFFIGAFDDKSGGQDIERQDKEGPDDIQFDPWKDEWYGTGPWWKKW